MTTSKSTTPPPPSHPPPQTQTQTPLQWKLIREKARYYTSELYIARPKLSPKERKLNPLPDAEIVAKKLGPNVPLPFPAVFIQNGGETHSLRGARSSRLQRVGPPQDRRDGWYALGVFVTGVPSNPERFCDFNLVVAHHEAAHDDGSSKKTIVSSVWRVPMHGAAGRASPRLSPRVHCLIEDDPNKKITPCSAAAVRRLADRFVIHVLDDHENGAYSRVVDAVMKDAGFEHAWASAKKALLKSFFPERCSGAARDPSRSPRRPPATSRPRPRRT